MHCMDGRAGWMEEGMQERDVDGGGWVKGGGETFGYVDGLID